MLKSFSVVILTIAALGMFSTAPLAQAADDEESLLERGRYLMNSIVACGNCHTPQTAEGPVPGMELAGGPPLAVPGMMVAFAPNITPDPETGIGSWTDAEIAASIREGRRPDGSLIGPPMPIEQYRHMSDRDVAAIVAYLRSVPPVKNESPPSTYEIPLPPTWGPPVGAVPEPDRSDRLAYGAYLSTALGHCIECHTPLGARGFDYENRAYAGGIPFEGPWGISVSPNITPSAQGIGSYSDEDIKRAITQGKRPDGSPLLPPMPYSYYSRMSDADLDAIVLYLRSLPPKSSE